MSRSASLSVVTPALDEEKNLPLLYDRLTAALGTLGLDWEWIVVDDASADATSAVVAGLAARDRRVRGLRLATSSGSHAAMLRGLAASRGAAAVVLAGDLQDPPELCAELLGCWRRGARVVWAVRRDARRGWLAAAPSRLYHALLRHLRGARGLPPGGAGFCLLDRAVVEALRRRQPPPVDLFAAVGRLRLAAATVLYDRAPRRHGGSGWSWRKKVRFAMRSLLAAP
jgi:glycosyltransferase involved in cell wall biosynthesis